MGIIFPGIECKTGSHTGENGTPKSTGASTFYPLLQKDLSEN